MAHNGIVDADAWTMPKITNTRCSGFIGHSVERFPWQMKHQGMIGVSYVGHPITSQIVDRSHSRRPVHRSYQAPIEVKIVIVASAQLQRNEIGILVRDMCCHPKVRPVVFQFGNGPSWICEVPASYKSFHRLATAVQHRNRSLKDANRYILRTSDKVSGTTDKVSGHSGPFGDRLRNYQFL